MAAGRKTILLVEDEAIVAMAEKAALEKYGYAVVAVSSGEAAVEAARTSPGIELVLMDIDLGAGLDGTQAARAILAERELPILFLSSHTEREVVEKTERISSYGYVVKDSSIAVLDASIKMAFKLFEANARLEASEARYRHSFDNAALGVCHVGLDGRFQEVNLAFRRMTGYSEEELAGRAFADITLPEDRAVGADVFRRMVRGEMGSATFEKRYVRKDGSVFWASVSTSLVRTGTLPDRFVTQVMDITGRVEAGERLKRSEAKYRNLYESIRDAVVSTDLAGNFTDANKVFLDLLGYSLEELRSLNFHELTPPEAREAERAAISRQLEEKGYSAPYLKEYIRKDGSRVPAEISVFLVKDEAGVPTGLWGIVRDVTGRRQAEDALRKSKETAERLLGVAAEIIISEDLEGKVLLLNDSGHRILGYGPGELVGRNFFDLCVPEDARAEVRGYFRRLGDEASDEILVHENDVLAKSGERKTILWRNAVIRDEAGKAVGLFSSGEDVTARRAAERRLRERSEAYEAANEELRERERALLRQNEVFASLLRCIPIGVFMVEAPSGKPILANEAAAELLGRGVLPDVTKDSLAEVYASYKAGTSEPYPLAEMPVFLGMSGVTAHVDDMEVRRPDGTKTLLEVFGTPVADEGGRVWASLVSFLDITEKKAAEARIRALLTEKELLLREVHHRIKNNMATMGSLLSLQAGNTSDPFARAALADAEKRLRSMGLLYDRLYRSPSLVALSAREYLEPLVDEILEKLMPGDKAVSVEKSIEDFTLDADRLQPLGIIVNELLSNALKHAFKGRSRGRIAVSAWSRDGRFTLRVEDDGVGLPPSVDFDSAPGFGLRLVKGLAEQLGGTARIERGGGTRFVLEFGERGPAG
ncbi:MAG TPA: PAS domain S-box protein [Spirochaetales bacterium]|nr:PAS domain S-box protein [Spirochaetales bacterium]